MSKPTLRPGTPARPWTPATLSVDQLAFVKAAIAASRAYESRMKLEGKLVQPGKLYWRDLTDLQRQWGMDRFEKVVGYFCGRGLMEEGNSDFTFLSERLFALE